MVRIVSRLCAGDARDLSPLSESSVDLVVTSPPYPMIAMWDEQFRSMNPLIGERLEAGDGPGSFELMHDELDRVWGELFRVLKEGGIACINIGDAARTVRSFALYSNHARVLTGCLKTGFTVLPIIHWRKTTNAPNKFMGSGMLPAGGYVTLGHEYVLVLRKGGNRRFVSESEKENRRRSAYFWEERNRWFSDSWDFGGARQNTAPGMRRSGAFPFELAYRLIQMFSVHHDTVLDPFLGTGTTALASIASCRSCTAIETDSRFLQSARERILGSEQLMNGYIADRLRAHTRFASDLRSDEGYRSTHHHFRVKTRQETEILLRYIETIEAPEPFGNSGEPAEIRITVTYGEEPASAGEGNDEGG